jgi:hypothetical protein
MFRAAGSTADVVSGAVGSGEGAGSCADAGSGAGVISDSEGEGREDDGVERTSAKRDFSHFH